MDKSTEKDIKRLEELRRAADVESLNGSSAANALVMSEEIEEKLEQLEVLQKNFKRVRGIFRTGVVVLVILLLYMFFGLVTSYFKKSAVEPEITPAPSVTLVPVSKDFGEYTFTYTMQEIPKLDISKVDCIRFGELRERAQSDKHFDAIDGISITDLNDTSQDDVLLFSYNDLGVEIAKQNRIYDVNIANGITEVVPSPEYLNSAYLDIDTVTYLQKYSDITLEELQVLEPGKSYSVGVRDTEYYTHDMYYSNKEFKENGKVYANYDEIKAVTTYTTFDLRVYDDKVDLNELANAIDGVLESYEYTLEATSTEELIGVYNRVGSTISKFTSDFTLTSAVDSNLGYETCGKSESDKHHEITIIIKDHAVSIPLYIEYYNLFEEPAEPTPTPVETIAKDYIIEYSLLYPSLIDLDSLNTTTFGELRNFCNSVIEADLRGFRPISTRLFKPEYYEISEYDNVELYNLQDIADFIDSQKRQFSYMITDLPGEQHEDYIRSLYSSELLETPNITVWYLTLNDYRHDSFGETYYVYDGCIVDEEKDAYLEYEKEKRQQSRTSWRFIVDLSAISLDEINAVVTDVLGEFYHTSLGSSKNTLTLGGSEIYELFGERINELTRRSSFSGDYPYCKADDAFSEITIIFPVWGISVDEYILHYQLFE